MAQQSSKIDSRDFKKWVREWYNERKNYPCMLWVSLREPLRENNSISAHVFPHTEVRHILGCSEEPRYSMGYELTLCLLNEKLKPKFLMRLETALAVIKDLQGLEFNEGWAFMIQVYLIFIDFERAKRRKKSLLFAGPTERDIADHPKGSQIRKNVMNKPLLSLDSLLDFWNIVGARFSKGSVGTPPDGCIGRPTYQTIPACWIRKEDMRAILGEIIDLPKIPIWVDADIYPLVEKLPEISRSLKAVLDLPYEAEKKSTPTITKFPRMEGLNWEEVSMEFVSNDSVRIKARNTTKIYTYIELGFKDHRKGDLPNSRWEILKDGFAHYEGEISWDTNIEPKWRPNLKSAVSDLRKRLKEIMGIDDDPFHPYRKVKAYRTKFRIKDLSYNSRR